jgi:hypothetical protein
MHFSTLFLAVLLPFSLALPRTKTSLSTDGFFVSNLHAFTAADADRNSSVSFVVYEESYQFGYMCELQTKGPLYSDMMWYACKLLMGSKTDKMSFQVSEDFTELRMKRTWLSK